MIRQSIVIRIIKYLATFLLFLLFAVLINRNYDRARLRKLNYIMPTEYQILAEDRTSVTKWDRIRFQPYRRYYQLLTELKPQMGEAFHSLGFFAFYQGDVPRAVAAFEKAVKRNPMYFWTWYNLGAINYGQQRWEVAAQYFQRALNIGVQYYPLIVFKSKIYTDIFQSVKDPRFTSVDHLRNGYERAHQMIALAHLHNRNYTAMLNVGLAASYSGINPQGRSTFYAGLASLRLKNYREALAYFESMLKEGHENPEVFAALAETYHALGMEEPALLMEQIRAQRENDTEPSLLAEPPVQLFLF